MAKVRNKTKHTESVPNANRRISGRLRPPSKLSVRRVSDFSTSFTQKLKSNNNTLAKSLATAKAINERCAEEIKFQRANYTELLMQKNSDEARHKESIRRMNGLVVKGMSQIRDAVDTLITMQEELRAMKADENLYRRFPSELSQQRASGSTQTLSVGPMVQGHSILQPKVTLSRINPPLRNGGRVPAAPVPAVPASADARASPARRQTAALAPAPVVDEESPVETIASFYERVRRENPMEGSSSGKRHRPFRPPPLEQPLDDEDDDDDDDDDFQPITGPCDRTSYSPTNMDITLGSRRLSTIVQETSPSLANVGTDLGGDFTPPPNRRFLEVTQVSPIEPTFYGFNEPEADARDRSRVEQRSSPWNGLGSTGTGLAGPSGVVKPVIKIRIADRPKAQNAAKSTAGPCDSNECKVDKSEADPGGVRVQNVVISDPISWSDITGAEAKTDQIGFSKHKKASGSQSEINDAKTKTIPSGASHDGKPKRTAESIGSSELKADRFSASTSGSSAGEAAKTTPDPLANPIGSKERNQAKPTTETKPSGSSNRRRAATRPSVLDDSYDYDGEARSAPNPLTKRSKGCMVDPDWTPVSEPGCKKLRVKRKLVIKHLVNEPDSVVQPDGRDVSTSHDPHVVVDRMNPGVIAEALSRSSRRSLRTKEEGPKLEEGSGGDDPMEHRARRRVRPTSYKEPSLIGKLRRK